MRPIRKIMLSAYRNFSHIYLLRVILAAIIPIMLFSSVMVPFRVYGLSMAPTYKHYSFNFCWRGAYFFSEPKRFDVVLVRLANQNGFLIKRIIGLPGETVEFKKGKTYINGKRLNEPFIVYPWDWDMAPVIIQDNHVYIVGDNRNVKIYQHTFGAVPINQIMGTALW